MEIRGDIRFAVRLAVRNPTSTLAAIIILSIGIGANELAFSFLNSTLNQPLPFKESARLVKVYDSIPEDGLFTLGLSRSRFHELEGDLQAFEAVAAYVSPNPAVGFDLVTRGELPERVPGAVVSANLFALLGVAPVLGRGFATGEGEVRANLPPPPLWSRPESGEGQVVVLSHRLWQRRFGGDPNVIGRPIHLNGRPYQVIGVMPPGFDFPAGSELWVPGVDQISSVANLWTHLEMNVSVVARLRAGVSFQQAQAWAAAQLDSSENQLFATDHPVRLRLVPLRQDLVGNVRPIIFMLFGASTLVFLIACVDVTNLLLARSVSRRKEIAVRRALGATGRQLAFQLLLDSALVAGGGGVLAFLMLTWGRSLFTSMVGRTSPWPGFGGIDITLVGFALAISALTALACGLPSAQACSRLNLTEILNGVEQAVSSRSRLRSLFIAGQVAMATALSLGAGAMLWGVHRLQSAPLGFSTKHVLYAVILPRGTHSPEQLTSFLARALDTVRALPGVQAAGLTSWLPLETGNRPRILLSRIDGGSPAPSASPFAFDCASVSADYFRTLDIPLLRGTYFNAADISRAASVAIVDRRFAERYWPGGDPLGQRLFLNGGGSLTIVGVVGSVRADYFRPDEPLVYVPYTSAVAPQLSLKLVVKATRKPELLALSLRRAVYELEPLQGVQLVSTLEQAASDSLRQPRLRSIGLLFLAALGLTLAAGGVYSVTSYLVQGRSHEIGIRMALGARPVDVKALVLIEVVRTAALGVAAGLALGAALNRVVANLFYGAGAFQPWVYLAVSVVLLAASVLAAYLPARRASRVDPLVALRAQ
jgi:putative ABC transport system permease protein